MARFYCYRTQCVRLALPVLLLSSVSTMAQDATLPTITVGGQQPAEEAGLHLTQPAATGSRLGLTPLETPASVEVITGETIRARGYATVNETVSHATGFNSLAAPGNGGTSLGVRGFTGHSSVMQLYDGTQFYVGAGTVTYPFDTWSIDRIEVLRGPASVMYGQGAIGGVLNVIPKKPTRIMENEGLLEFGSDFTRRAAAGSAGSLGGKLSYRADVSGRKSDGWVDRGENESLAFGLALKADVSEDFAITLSHDYGYQQPQRYFGTPLVNGNLDKSLRNKNYNVGDSLVEYRDNWTRLNMDWQAADNVKITNTAYMLTSDRHWRNAESYAFVPATGLINRTSYLEILHDQTQYGNRGDVAVDYSLLGMKNQTVAGFDINHIDFRHVNDGTNGFSSTVSPYGVSPGSYGQGSFIPRYDTDTDQYSLFAEDRLSVTDTWSLIGGLRYDNIDISRSDLVTPANSFEKTFTHMSWRAGTVYNIASTTALYAQYVTAADPVGGLITLSAANSSYKLATGRQIEAGVKQSFMQGRGEWTFAGYQIEKKNILSRSPINPAVTQQVGEQSSRGVEATLGFDLDPAWRIEANAALLDARFDNFVEQVSGVAVSRAGNTPPQVPEQLANLWLTWKFAPDWKVLGAARWVGETWSDNANTQRRAAYTVFDLGVTWSPVPNADISFRIYNLLDETYAISSSGTTQWLLGAPRTALLTTAVKF